MARIIRHGHLTLNFGLRVRGILIILPSKWLMLIPLSFLVGRELMLTYAWFSRIRFTLLWNHCFMPTTHLMKTGNRPNYCTPMTLNVYMVFVTTCLMWLLLVLKTLWEIMWVRWLIFFMNLMKYYLLPLLLLRKSSNDHASSWLWCYTDLLKNIFMFVIRFWVHYYTQFYLYLFHPFACALSTFRWSTCPCQWFLYFGISAWWSPPLTQVVERASQVWYGKFDHKIDRCYALHGCLPRSTVVAHTNPSSQPSFVDPQFFVFASNKSTIFNEFLKWSKDRKLSSSTASIAYICTSFAGLTQSSFVGPWVFDSGATDHITGNKSMFSSLSSLDNLPSVTMANGSRVLAHGVGTVDLFPFLSIGNVLYVPESPINLLSISRLTRSLDCVISFTQSSVCL